MNHSASKSCFKMAATGGAIRRRTLIAAGSLAWLSPALAQYPDRPVKVVVPWPAGGLVDAAARSTFDRVQQAIGQTFVIDNKPGAGGAIGANAVVQAAPDGLTLVVTTSAICIGEALQIKQPFQVIRDFEPVALLANAPVILVVHPDSGVKSVADLIAKAKRKPGSMSYASAGNGSPAHLAGEWFKALGDFDATHVAYKGAPAAMIDQIAGRVDFQFANAAVGLPQIRAGKVVPIAVGSATPLSFLPGVPTMAQAGMTGFDADQWLGVLAPAGTPRAVVDVLARRINDALRDPGLREAMVKSGIVPAEPGGSPAEFGKLVAADLARWTSVVKRAHIKVE